MTEDSIDNQSIYSDDTCWNYTGDYDEPYNGYALYFGIRVLNRDIIQREALAETRQLVENEEYDAKSTVLVGGLC